MRRFRDIRPRSSKKFQKSENRRSPYGMPNNSRMVGSGDSGPLSFERAHLKVLMAQRNLWPILPRSRDTDPGSSDTAADSAPTPTWISQPRKGPRPWNLARLFVGRSSTFVPAVEVGVLILILIQEYWIISGRVDQNAQILLSLVSDRRSELGVRPCILLFQKTVHLQSGPAPRSLCDLSTCCFGIFAYKKLCKIKKI